MVISIFMELFIIFLKLFYTFFIIGVFTFGGGYAMLSLIQGQVVNVHHWISASTFTDIVAISQMTPGPIGINSATYVGYEVIVNNGGSHFLGILGSFTTTIALVLPSFFIILLLVHFYNKYGTHQVFGSVMYLLKPCVIGLIGAAACIMIFRVTWDGTPLFSKPSFSILKDNFIDYKSWILLIVSGIAAFKFKINPILIIIAAGLIGLVIF